MPAPAQIRVITNDPGLKGELIGLKIQDIAEALGYRGQGTAVADVKRFCDGYCRNYDQRKKSASAKLFSGLDFQLTYSGLVFTLEFFDTFHYIMLGNKPGMELRVGVLPSVNQELKQRLCDLSFEDWCRIVSQIDGIAPDIDAPARVQQAFARKPEIVGRALSEHFKVAEQFVVSSSSAYAQGWAAVIPVLTIQVVPGATGDTTARSFLEIQADGPLSPALENWTVSDVVAALGFEGSQPEERLRIFADERSTKYLARWASFRQKIQELQGGKKYDVILTYTHSKQQSGRYHTHFTLKLLDRSLSLVSDPEIPSDICDRAEGLTVESLARSLGCFPGHNAMEFLDGTQQGRQVDFPLRHKEVCEYLDPTLQHSFAFRCDHSKVVLSFALFKKGPPRKVQVQLLWKDKAATTPEQVSLNELRRKLTACAAAKAQGAKLSISRGDVYERMTRHAWRMPLSLLIRNIRRGKDEKVSRAKEGEEEDVGNEIPLDVVVQEGDLDQLIGDGAQQETELLDSAGSLTVQAPELLRGLMPLTTTGDTSADKKLPGLAQSVTFVDSGNNLDGECSELDEDEDSRADTKDDPAASKDDQ